MAENDIKIKDAPLVDSVTGNEKIPVSDGSNLPKAVTTGQIVKGTNDKIERLNQSVAPIEQNLTNEIARAKTKESEITNNLSTANEALTSEINRATSAEQENAEAIKDVEALLYALSAETNSVGFARLNGSSDPTAETQFGTDEMYDKVLSHFHLGVFKNGELVKQMKDGYLTVAVDGTTIAIDGSMGDVGAFTDVPVFKLCETMNVGGRELNVVALGLQPFSWYEKNAKRIEPFALSPDGTVNAKVGDDVRSQAHTIYNKSVGGTYSAPIAIFKGSYKTSGGGYPSQNCSCVGSIQNAQNKNTNATDGKPYMSGYYEFFEIFAALILARCQSTCHTQLTNFGTGCTPMDSVGSSTFNDTAISGNSGWKIILSDGNARYIDLWGNEYVRLTSEATAKQHLIGGIAGTSYYGVCEILEAQRVLDGINKAGLASYIGSNSNIFTMDTSGNVSVITDGSVNVSDGTGMTSLKHYYIVRNVPNFRGLADGKMTAVVNSYTKFEFADGVVLNSDNTDMTGCIAIAKRSIPVFIGWALPYHGYFVQSDGAFYVIINDNGTLSAEFRSASSVDKIPARTAFGYDAALGSEADIEKGLDKRIPISYGANEGWAKKSNYSMSLFCHTQTGGGSRTHESAYLWVYPSNNGGANTRQVHGSVLGCAAYAGPPYASVRTARCDYHAGSDRGGYVGSWSLTFLNLNQK